LLLLVILLVSLLDQAHARDMRFGKAWWIAMALYLASFFVWCSGLFRRSMEARNQGRSKRVFARTFDRLTLLYGVSWCAFVCCVYLQVRSSDLQVLVAWSALGVLLSSHLHASGPLRRAAWTLIAIQSLGLVVAGLLVSAPGAVNFETGLLVVALTTGYRLAGKKDEERRGMLRLKNEWLDEKNQLLTQASHLKSANDSKARLLAMVSHDLRQPVHALGLMLGRLRRDVFLASQRIEVEAVNEVVNSLSQSLSKLMAVTRLNSGQMSTLPEAVSLDRLFGSLANEFYELGAERKLQLLFDGQGLNVLVDPHHLRTILMNLISNAIKYSEQGEVRVQARASASDSRRVVINVQDTGVGIPPDQLERIFEPFVRLQFSKSSAGGIGLGLAIVKQTAELINAPIEVVSEVHRGTTFSITLPCSETSSVQAQPTNNASLRGLRVVVVDNDETVLESMAKTLEEWGCRVIAAGGLESLEVKLGMTVSPIDLILSDFHLDGGLSGYELIQRLRKRLGSDIPSILLTGDVEVRHGPDSTATAVVIAYKPLSYERLAMLIGETVYRHRKS
jgi:signal transduction histidine kinase